MDLYASTSRGVVVARRRRRRTTSATPRGRGATFRRGDDAIVVDVDVAAGARGRAERADEADVLSEPFQLLTQSF
jgi:hypothetical protein